RAGEYFLIGSVVRDMQIIIKECENNRPELNIPDDICVEAGTNIQELITATDADGDDVKIEVLSAVLHFQESPATFDPDPPVFQPQPGQVLFQWQTTCEHVREQPYLVHFKVTDRPPEGVALVEFGTMNVTVVGPSPKDLISQVNPNRTIDLSWDPYSCQYAESIQVWRRIDSYSFTPDECETGMPERAGYTLINTIDASQSTYTDNNNGKLLNFDAKYCYRLVAQYPLPKGGESYVSNETCGIIIADGPAITHVTVDETSQTEGKITVSWRGPFEIDQVLFPPPYSYELWRGTGLSGAAELEVMPLSSDTTFQDTGLDTRNSSYHYIVKLFDGSGFEVTQSVSASQVRLEPTPLLGAIELNWNADVPWTNNSQSYPMHYIYRDNSVAGDETQIILIDSVDVTTEGFFYADDGSFNSDSLDDQTEYCYYIQAEGTYGNPKVIAPQTNFSQIICARPNDTIPPCEPELFIEMIDCEAFLADKDCSFSDFFNEIYWTYDFNIEECDEDLKGFNIYYSYSGEEGTFSLLDFVTDTSYVHSDLNSFIGCYYITAVDRSNNESLPSQIVCNDNCPYYKLPNIITPNDDGFNDTFRPFDENSPDINAQCPRFVESVKFKVFNRWGGLLYEYKSGGENTININWDGRDSNGRLLPAGNYYYSVDVIFDIREASERDQTLTGWVQVLY
ncbi:MAG: gliding motility-associated C-terminal domain-containing protein, partial [Bacteroidota bacterium]